MPKIVSIHYSPKRWNQLLSRDNTRTPTKGYHPITDLGFTPRLGSGRGSFNNSPVESKSSSPSLEASEPPTVPTVDVSQLSVLECLDRMSKYKELLANTDQAALEKEWLGEVHKVALKLQLIRECYKVVQSVNRKRNMIKNASLALILHLAPESTPIPSDAIEMEDEDEDDPEDDEVATSQGPDAKSVNSPLLMMEDNYESSGSTSEV